MIPKLKDLKYGNKNISRVLFEDKVIWLRGEDLTCYTEYRPFLYQGNKLDKTDKKYLFNKVYIKKVGNNIYDLIIYTKKIKGMEIISIESSTEKASTPPVFKLTNVHMLEIQGGKYLKTPTFLVTYKDDGVILDGSWNLMLTKR